MKQLRLYEIAVATNSNEVKLEREITGYIYLISSNLSGFI